MSDYPEANTAFYAVYCYSNFNKSIFSIGCTTQLLVALIAVAVGVLLSLLLCRLPWNDPRQRLKIVAMCLALAAQLLTFIYYSSTFQEFKPAMLIILNMVETASQYLVTYICCQKSCRLLQNYERWIVLLKLIGIVAFCIQMGLLVYDSIETLIHEHNDSEHFYASCATLFWFMLNCSKNLVLCFFVCVGLYILRSIRKYEP